MDDRHFDRLTLALSERLSRRGMGRLGIAGSGFLATLGAPLAHQHTTEAKKKRKNKKRKKKRKKNGKPKSGPACTPSCLDKTCGSDGCGNNTNCGACTGNLICTAGSCACPRQASCGDDCCASNQTCIADRCCPTARACGETCCDNGQTCVAGACCPDERACEDVCCEDGQVCAAGTCCDRDARCGNACCAEEDTCLDTGCCPDEQTCAGACCRATETCIDGACCANGRVCHGDTCCTANQTCLVTGCCTSARACDGVCCPQGQTCVDDTCCPAGSDCGDVCCGDGAACIAGACCPAARACHGSCCAEGYTCTAAGCCPFFAVCGQSCCWDAPPRTLYSTYDIFIEGEVAGISFQRTGTLSLYAPVFSGWPNVVDVCLDSGYPLGSPAVGALTLGSNAFCASAINHVDLADVWVSTGELNEIMVVMDGFTHPLCHNVFTRSNNIAAIPYSAYEGGTRFTVSDDGAFVEGFIALGGMGDCGTNPLLTITYEASFTGQRR